jgi:valine dehydrogenase (NAD+)
MSTFEDPWEFFQDHEQVILGSDPETGLTAVVAIHSTRLGPALGGTRMSAYADSPHPRLAAYADALRLARAMSLKNALAGLPHGGGKGVIIADPQMKSTQLLHAYGRFLTSLNGRYITAGDVGMSVDDMDTISDTCAWVTGRSPDRGGVGDSGILTAHGVRLGMRAAAEHLWGTADLAGRRIGIVGAGKVGGRLAASLTADGAEVVVFDPSEQAQGWLADHAPAAKRANSLEELLSTPLDILSPNALGGFLTPERSQVIDVKLICGGANNQLATPEVADLLAQRGILYTPDFLVNCGGVIQVAEERVGADLDRARAKVDEVFATTQSVLDRAQEEQITPVRAAEREALDRIAAGA